MPGWSRPIKDIILEITLPNKLTMYRTNYSNRFNRSRPRGFSSKNNHQPQVDISLYVKKAQEVEEEFVYVPKHTFADFPIHERIKANISQKGYVTPTPIQDQAIPHLLEGRDVVGIANTGTGKTAAFLIPLINKIHFNRNQKVIIITPTRELALQIDQEFRAFAGNLNLYSALCIGGANINTQISTLRRNPHFVIGTPGRLKDLIERRSLNLSTFSNIVLDEVDRMMDMGFIKDVRFLISHLPSLRQSLFFSATINPEITGIMHSLLKDPITISVKTQETAANVDQDIIKINGQRKADVLHDLLIQDEYKKVLVFGRTKHGVEKLAKELAERGFKVAALHSNKTQGQRQKALSSFKLNQVNVLLATDVASRGLDIDDVTHVINYDLPQNYQDYIHRIGRTGRANKKGSALTFVD